MKRQASSKTSYTLPRRQESGVNPMVATVLAKFLTSTYTLFLHTLIQHWNVAGPHFASLHKLFAEQYQNLQEAGDEIAERMRAMGAAAPSRVEDLISDSSALPANAPWQDRVRYLYDAQRRCSAEARAVLQTAEQAQDYVTMDLMTERMAWHDKAAWMLRSLIEA